MAAELKIGIGADITELNKGLQDAEKQIAAFINKIGTITVPKIVVPPIVMPKVPTVEIPPIAVPDIPPIVIPPIAPIPPIDVPDVPPIVIPPIDDKPIKDLKEKLKDLGETMSSIGQKMSVAITLPIVALGTAAIKAYGDLQSLNMGLISVMGSSGAAAKEFEKLREVAKLPGLGFQEAVRGSVSLQAAGFSADQARKSLLAFGNALATVGKGANEMNYVVLALTQLQNKAGGFGQDLRQLTEQLPQLRGALLDAFGTMDTEVIGKMGFTGAQVVEKLTAEFAKLPKVTGGIKNAFENLGDNIFVNMSRIGKIIDDTFDISGIIDKLTGYLDTAISYFESLSPAVQKTILVVTGLVAAAGPLLVIVGGFIAALPTMLAGIGALGAAFTFLTGPIGLVVVGIGAIIAAVVSNWDKIKPYITKTIQWFVDLYNESLVVRIGVEAIMATFRTSFSIIGNILKTAWELIKSFAKGVAEAFAGVGTVIKGVLTGDFAAVGAGIKQIGSAVTTTLSSYFNDLKNGIKQTFSDIGKIANEGAARVMGGKISAPKLFDEAEVADETEKTLTAGIAKGVKKLKPIKVELPDIEPIIGTMNYNFIDDFGNEVANAWNLDDAFNAMADTMRNSIPLLTQAMGEVQLSVMENMISLREEFAQIADFGNFLGDAIATSFNFVTDTIADSFAAIGEAMATGGNILGSVGEVILGGIASFLSTLGKQMIQYGVAALAMAVLSKLLLNPITAAPAAVAMIAAGAALSLIGGAIKGTLSGGGSSGAVPSGGGNSSQSYSSSFSGGGSGGEGRVVFEISGNSLLGVLDRAKDRNTRLGG